jgi:hypothetical protein
VAPEEVANLEALYGGGEGNEGDEVPVTPDNWLAVQVFLVQESRWRRHPAHGAPEGLDLAQVEAALRLMGVKRKKRQGVFWKLRTMEVAALEEMAR